MINVRFHIVVEGGRQGGEEMSERDIQEASFNYIGNVSLAKW